MQKYPFLANGPDEDTDWDDAPMKEQENDHSDDDDN